MKKTTSFGFSTLVTNPWRKALPPVKRRAGPSIQSSSSPTPLNEARQAWTPRNTRYAPPSSLTTA